MNVLVFVKLVVCCRWVLSLVVGLILVCCSLCLMIVLYWMLWFDDDGFVVVVC